MGLPSFFKIPSHSIFDYKPLYYDERKEERERRNELIKQEMGINSTEMNEYKPQIKGQIRRQIAQNRRHRKSSNLRLIVIIAALTFLAYYIFYF